MPIIDGNGIYSRFDPAKNHDEILFRAGKVLQSAELNDWQKMEKHRRKGIADALFKDGDVIRDAQCVVDAETGYTQCQSGALYLSGAVRGVLPATLTIPTVGIVTLGIYMVESVITELEDPALRDPAVGTRNYEEPGAVRLAITPVWGYAGDGQEGDFYPVYTVEDGVLRAKEPPPQLDAVTQALARYDRDSAGGTYIVEGLRVAMSADTAAGEQVYTVSEGRARVNGYGVELPAARRLVYAATPDTRLIDSEPHQSATFYAQRINVDRWPIGEITQVRVTLEKTATILHGSFTGAQDALPDTAILTLLSVTQGETTYAPGTDYRLTAGKVDWSPSGAEPAPGSSYSVTYQYIATVAPTEADETGFTIEGAVPDTLIMVSYTVKLPRYDRLCLSAEGAFTWLKGVAADDLPIPPRAPCDQLLLATVSQTWMASGVKPRRVTQDGVRTVPMQDIYAIGSRLDHILALVAQQRLEASANLIEAGAKKGLFVDPFLDDSMRDAGVEQTAQILAGELSLFINTDAFLLSGDLEAPAALPHTRATALEQTLKTSAMPVNPYLAFSPPPLAATLTPAVDQWVEKRTITYSSMKEITGAFSSTVELPFLRQIPVAFAIAGFGENESVETLTFDGINITGFTQANDGHGNITGQFTIPAFVPVGVKQARFTGSGGATAEARFVGSNDIVTSAVIMRPPSSGAVDPLAQTFTLTRRVQVVAVELWFAAAGPSGVTVQIRETAGGFPTRTALSETKLPASALLVNGQPTRVIFPAPLALEAEREYALVVLSTDAETALQVAELGKYDAQSGKWVTSQPYQIGVLLSSSNAATWTAHQDRDLAFRLLEARFTETTRVIDLGVAEVNDATDLMALAVVDIPDAAAHVAFDLTLPDGATTLRVALGQPLQLPVAVSGEVRLRALLSGDTAASPVLWPGSQLIAGAMQATGDYVSRAIPAGQDARVRVIFDALIPPGAAVSAAISGIDAEDDWQEAVFASSLPVDDGFVEHVYEVESISEDRIRVKLTLTGHTAARPRVKNLRVIVT
ncbi:MAG: DUF4815 domain-containing protein [Zoogloeaceae bacterium]|jgi:hypothetical protein|nr:DUF4815 domain-containing protein [Zoogloeaceae bacterium]